MINKISGLRIDSRQNVNNPQPSFGSIVLIEKPIGKILTQIPCSNHKEQDLLIELIQAVKSGKFKYKEQFEALSGVWKCKFKRPWPHSGTILLTEKSSNGLAKIEYSPNKHQLYVLQQEKKTLEKGFLYRSLVDNLTMKYSLLDKATFENTAETNVRYFPTK